VLPRLLRQLLLQRLGGKLLLLLLQLLQLLAGGAC
jgi:hypothetical protein